MSTTSQEISFTPEEHTQMAMQAFREGRWVSEVILERLAEKQKAMEASRPAEESTATTQPIVT